MERLAEEQDLELSAYVRRVLRAHINEEKNKGNITGRTRFPKNMSDEDILGKLAEFHNLDVSAYVSRLISEHINTQHQRPMQNEQLSKAQEPQWMLGIKVE